MPELEEKARATVSRASVTSAGESSPSAVEYAIIAVLIAAVAVGTWKTFGEGPQPDASGERAVP
jgi:hypothetical protein